MTCDKTRRRPKIPKQASDWRRWRGRGANLVEEMEGERCQSKSVEPNPEVCHLRSYDGEEFSCHEETPSRPPATRGECMGCQNLLLKSYLMDHFTLILKLWLCQEPDNTPPPCEAVDEYSCDRPNPKQHVALLPLPEGDLLCSSPLSPLSSLVCSKFGQRTKSDGDNQISW